MPSPRKKPTPKAKVIKAKAMAVADAMVEVLKAENKVRSKTMFFSPEHANLQAKKDVAIIVRRHQVLKAKYQKAFDELQRLILSM
jgi:hypothetical protein